MTKGKKILKTIGCVIGVIILGVLVIAAGKPDDYRYERSTTMAAAPGKIFQQVNNLKNWNDWSPWAKLDPAAKVEYAGPAAGKNAAMRWDGNNKIGVGTMTITDSQSNQRVAYHLEFEKPMKGMSDSEITLERQPDGQTLVKWAMFGKQNYTEKVIGTIMNCERMMNKAFDEGLANLKAVVEPKA